MTNTTRILEAIKAATCQMGPNKGRLLKKSPGYSNPDAAAAWQALTLEANPYKVSIGAVMMMAPEQREIFEAVRRIVTENHIDVRALDRDRVALESLGVW